MGQPADATAGQLGSGCCGLLAASFTLQAGLPQFSTGRITLVRREPPGIMVWQREGEPGFRYLIEKRVDRWNWEPYLLLTNHLGTVEFTTRASQQRGWNAYRSRILD